METESRQEKLEKLRISVSEMGIYRLTFHVCRIY
jgi:hypothetical protein